MSSSDQSTQICRTQASNTYTGADHDALIQLFQAGYTLETRHGHYRLQAPGEPDPSCHRLAQRLAPYLENLWREPRLANLADLAKDGLCPLAPTQARALNTQRGRLEPYLVLELRGPLKPLALEQALDHIVARHDILRTRFVHQDGGWFQEVQEAQACNLSIIEASISELHAWLQRLSPRWTEIAPPRQPWLPLLWRSNAHDHRLVVLFHPVVCDGISMAIFAAQLTEALLEPSYPEKCRLPQVSFTTHVRWYQHYWTGRRLSLQIAFWSRQLAHLSPSAALPLDKPTLSLQAYQERRLSFSAMPELRDKLVALARGQGHDLKLILLSAWVALLSRYAAHGDLSMGLPCQLRDQSEWHAALGAFENPVLLRCDLSGEPNFKTLLARLAQRARQLGPCSYAPLQTVAEQVLGAEHGEAYPLRGAFALYKLPRPQARGALRVSVQQARFASLGRDVSLLVLDRGRQLELEICYHGGRYDTESMNNLANCFHHLLGALPDQLDTPLSALPLLSDAMRATLLAFWQGSRPIIGGADNLSQCFTNAALRFGPLPALRTVADPLLGNLSLEYSVLDDWASRIASALRSRGVQVGEHVGIFLHGSADAVAAMIGTVRAGAVYVPFDPNCPAERISRMIQVTGVRRMITRTSLRALLPSRHEQLDYLFSDAGDSLSGDGALPALALPAQLPAYVMFTSGSTGVPKGVTVSHGAVLSLIQHLDWLRLGPGQVVLQASSLAFDASTFEIWGSLLQGATLVVPGEHLLDHLPSLIRRQGITTLWLTSHLFRYMVEEHLDPLTQVTQVVSGGDVLSPLHVARFLEHAPGQLFNGYGPTESTTFASCCALHQHGLTPYSAPIGRPLAHRQVYVLDAELKPLPPGARGQIYIAGAGLAQGYMDNFALTAARFLPNPFASDQDSGSRIYRTGDLGRYLQDGHLEFLGRRDRQLKIQGYMVEPNEVAALLEHRDAVAQALVLPLPDSEGKRCLAAFVRVAANIQIEAEAGEQLKQELHHYLVDHLPSELIPLVFVLLKTFPLTPAGKVDMDALPMPLQQATPQALGGSVNSRLNELIAQLLGVEYHQHVETYSEGPTRAHSPTRLAARVRKHLGSRLNPEETADISVAEIAAHLARIQEHPPVWDMSAMDDQPHPSPPPISWEQREVLQRTERAGAADPVNQMTLHLQMAGPLASLDLEQALGQLLARHEILRTRFSATHQLIDPAAAFTLPFVDFSGLADAEAALGQMLIRAARLAIDIQATPLWRLWHLRQNQGRHSLVFSAHRLLVDAGCLRHFMGELTQLLGAARPANPQHHYGHYARWQAKWLVTPVAAKHRNFWRQQLKAAPPHADFGGPLPVSEFGYSGADHLFHLADSLRAALAALSRQAGCTLSLICKTVYAMLLSQYSGQSDLLIGWIVSNRIAPQLEPLAGPLGNTLPLRVDLSGNPVFYELLERLRHQVREVRAHRAIPYALILEDSQIMPCQALYAWERPMEPTKHGAVQIKARLLPNGSSPGEICLNIVESENGIYGHLVYDRQRFDPQTIQRFGEQIRVLLSQVAARPDESLARLSPLSAQQRETLLRVWNQTTSDAPRDRSLARLFEDIAARVPHAEALRCPASTMARHGGRFSYGQLNRLANALALELTRLGVTIESPVLVALAPGPEALIALLALLKMGAIYVPLSESVADRLEEIGARAAAKHLIAGPNLITAGFSGAILVLDLQSCAFMNGVVDNPPDHIRPDHGACLFLNRDINQISWLENHHSLSNAVGWYRAHLGENTSTLLFAALDRAESLHEIFAAWCRGGRLVVCPRRRLMGDDGLVKTLRQESIDRLFVPHWMFKRLAHVFHQGQDWPMAREIIVYGQVPRPIQELARVQSALPHVEIYYRCDISSHLMISMCRAEEVQANPACLPGRPLDNIRLYVLDRHLRPVPLGVVGRLFVGGAGAPRAAWRSARASAARQVPDPFGPLWEEGARGGRLFDAATLARFVPGENGIPQGIMLLGEVDHRVVVEGRSLRLDHVATALSGVEQVWDVRVTMQQGEMLAEVCVDEHLLADSSLLRTLERSANQQLPAFARPKAIITRSVTRHWGHHR